MSMEILVCPSCLALNQLEKEHFIDHPKCTACHAELLPDIPIDADTALFNRLKEHSTLPIVADFWGAWSGSSHEMVSVFVRLSKRFKGDAVFIKVNSESEQVLAGQLKLCAIPTFILLKDGKEYHAKVVVSNANAVDTFRKMMDEEEHLKAYLARMDKLSISFSSFQVFIGLKKDLVKEVEIKDTEIFYYVDYDHEKGYEAALNAEIDKGGFGLTLYDNLYKGYSPEGKNIVNIIATQGYKHWEKYEADYWKGNKDAYRKEKEGMADVLIDEAEKRLLPGLREAIEVKEIGTPPTNVRYTSNPRGAIYGWDQTVDNSGPRRMAHSTPIKNLYLSGAWTQPGHGYSAVLYSGLQCFGEIMKKW